LSFFVDTSVWSLALRRDAPESGPEVRALIQAIEGGATLITTGLVLQELLQGFSGPKARRQILDRFSAVPFLTPDRDDHVRGRVEESLSARRRSNRTDRCTAGGVVHPHDLMMLTADNDVIRIAAHSPLKVWSGQS